ncbi:MAG: glycosyltransferase family 9 protein [Gammaproteobacteria bacterium]|nr:glycosyltransferase family 9 protein [Gammaproteobacteria bacterium]
MSTYHFNPSPQDFIHNAIQLFEKNNHDLALIEIDKGLPFHSENAYFWYLKSSILQAKEEFQLALSCIDKAIGLSPQKVEYWGTRGLILMSLLEYPSAVESFKKALTIDARSAITWYNLGSCFHKQKLRELALDCYHECIIIDIDYHAAYLNMAIIYGEIGCKEEEEKILSWMVEKWPKSAEANWNLGFLYLITGRFSQGWRLHDWRFQINHFLDKHPQFFVHPKQREPHWHKGLDIRGKHIFVYFEQGLGDCIQFVRFLPQLASMGATVLAGIPENIEPLLWNMPITLLKQGDNLQNFDYHCPMLSLPEAFSSDFDNINGQPYLLVDEARQNRWRQRVGAQSSRIRVGLVWMGGEHSDQPEFVDLNQMRNLSFEKIAQLNHPRIDFYNLQIASHGPLVMHPLLTQHWSTPNFYDFTPYIGNFADTAALIAQLDLVISVDTSVVHLAGAIGKPVWMLNRFNSDWRWLRNRIDNPWYESMTIYSQPEIGDWDSVLNAVAKDLALLISNPRQTKGLPNAKGLLLTKVERFFRTAQANIEAKRYEVALGLYDAILQIIPDHPLALDKKVKLLTDLGQDSIKVYRWDLHPHSTQTLPHLSFTWMDRRKWLQSLQDIHEAIQLEPFRVHAWTQRGRLLQKIKEDYASLMSLQISTLLPDDQSVPDAHFDAQSGRALALLHVGDYELGWQAYEWRRSHSSKREYKDLVSVKKRWLGVESLAGKTLLIDCDGNLGEVMMFSRYLKYLTYFTPKKLIIVVPKTLIALFQNGSFSLHSVSSSADPLPLYDFCCTLKSLPLLLKKWVPHIPRVTPFLQTPASFLAKWTKKIKAPNNRKIGLVWSEDETNTQARNLSLAEIMDSIGGLPVGFQSLQFGDHTQTELEIYRQTMNRNRPQISHHPDIESLADIAAIMENLDVIVSVDGAVAHLAGALHKTVFLLSSYNSPWYWGSTGETSAWYPSMVIIRQTQENSWEATLTILRQKLEGYLKTQDLCTIGLPPVQRVQSKT